MLMLSYILKIVDLIKTNLKMLSFVLTLDDTSYFLKIKYACILISKQLSRSALVKYLLIHK